MSTKVDTTESSSDAAVSTEPPSKSDAAICDDVKVAAGDDLLESNAGTLAMDSDTVVLDAVNDARVSGDERGIVVENAEKVLEEKEKEKEVNDEEIDGEYKVSDLVWGKVRNYPWWPGQIFDSSAATDAARKHSNKKGFLIAYFGDQSFAWNEKSKIKPFRKNFSKMGKQSDSPKFLHAVNCALDEALRRIKFGLSCSCLSKEVYDNIKSQTVVNAGIRKEKSTVDGGDNFSTVSTFKPANIVQSVQDLAREHFDGFDRLQVLCLHTQLFSYYRWKGYHQFSTQYFSDGLDNKLEDNSDIPSVEKPDSSDILLASKPDEKVSSKKRKLKDKKIVKDAKPVSDTPVIEKPDSKPDEKVSSKKQKLKNKKIVKDAKPVFDTPVIEKPDSPDVLLASKPDEKVSSRKRKLKDKKIVKDAKPVSDIPVLEKPDSPAIFSISQPDEKVSSKKRKSKDKKIVEEAKPVSVSVSEKDSKKRKLDGSESVNSKKRKHVSNGDKKNMTPKKKEKLLKKEGDKSRNGIADKKPPIPTPPPKKLFGVGASICKIAKQLSLSPLIPKKESKLESESQFQQSKDSNSNLFDQTEESTKSEASDSSEGKLAALIPNKESKSQFQRSKDSNSINEKNRVDQTEESTKSETSDSSEEKLVEWIPNKKSESKFQRSKKFISLNEKRVDQTEKSAALIPNKESESPFQSPKESNSIFDKLVDQTEESTKTEKSDSREEKLDALIPNKDSESQFQKSNSINEGAVDQTEESTKSETSDSSKEKLAALIPDKESESQFQSSKESNSINENRVDQTEESTKSEKTDSSKEKMVALILKFTNFDSIPSVMELNEIFRVYGSLMESETEVLKKSTCAKVVFEEKSNAESAYSSAGKFSIFGPSLVSYKLDFSPTLKKIYTRKGKKKSVGDLV